MKVMIKKKSTMLPSEVALHETLRMLLTEDMDARVVFGALLNICDPDAEVLNVENFASTAYSCGRRNVGMEIRQLIEFVAPGGYEACRSAYADYLERLAAERKVQKEKEVNEPDE